MPIDALGGMAYPAVVILDLIRLEEHVKESWI